METFDRDQSEFHVGFGKIGRINYLMWSIVLAKERKDADAWFNQLCSWATTVSNDMKEEELKYCLKKREDINKLIYIHNRNIIRNGMNEISAELYNELDNWERYLNAINKKAGLEMKYKDNPNFAIGG